MVSEVEKISDIILPKDKVIMRTFDKKGNEEVDKTSDDDEISVDIVLLVNENAASASEILAGALKDNKKATLVGTTTFGKGVMQEIFKLQTGAAMKITIQEFKTPNGDKIHEVGVKPDYEVEEGKDEKKDLQLEKAIEILKK
jgi:carboxyl-terminal processing protease